MNFRTTFARFALSLGVVPLFGASSGLPRTVAPEEIDAIFAPWDKAGSPGVALAIIHHGQIIYEKGYGFADLERGTRITPNTRLYVGSVSKQFTAAAVALLAQRGTVSLDDDVRKYVPELPNYGATITLRHLIHHTSGLRDYLTLRDIAGEPGNGTFKDDDVLKLLRRQKQLNFAPGTQHLYSNSGYFLLSVVVKRTTGKTLRNWAAESIFEPLGMQATEFRDDHTKRFANGANGYAAALSGSGYRVSNPNFDVVGAGGVFTTVRDFLAWDRNFYEPRVGDRALIALLQTPGKLNDGRQINYAFGLTVGTYRGLRTVEHGGAYGGFKAHVLRMPDQQFSVICFTNLGSMVPSRFTHEVATLYLGDQMRGPASAQATAVASGEAGKAAPAKSVKAKKRKQAAARSPVSTKPAQYAGEYFNDELQLTCRVIADDGQLTLARPNRAALQLQESRAAAGTFSAGTWVLKFGRDEQNGSPSFTLDAGRARGFLFVRR